MGNSSNNRIYNTILLTYIYLLCVCVPTNEAALHFICNRQGFGRYSHVLTKYFDTDCGAWIRRDAVV